jgi:Spy/CpxP family protein refolding chaperone
MRRTPTHSRIVPIAITLALAAGSVALAQGPGPGGPGPGPGFGDGPRLERLFERLDLSDEQQAEVEQLVAGHRDGMRPRLELLRDKRQALHEQIHAETFDESAIRTAAAELAEVEADVAVARGDVLQQLRGVLTPEQAAEMQELIEQRQQRFQEGPGKGRRHFHRRHGGPHGHF